MDIQLAGMNVDKDLLDNTKLATSEIVLELHDLARQLNGKNRKIVANEIRRIRRKAKKISRTEFTPESISAAYARISRRQEDIPTLREEASERIKQARETNTNVVHGVGHNSIAEHAVFNLDIMGVSRLFVNFLEKARLCSYTEKSMRYVLFSGDYLVPKEVVGTGFEKLFRESADRKFSIYREGYEKALERAIKTNPELAADMKKNRGRLEGYAKEDARYILPLSTLTQLGMTANARNLEYILAQAASSGLEETKEFWEKTKEKIEGIAPSLIKYIDQNDHLTFARCNLGDLIAGTDELEFADEPLESAGVKIVHSDPDSDNKILTALLFSAEGSNKSYGRLFDKVKSMESYEKLMIIKEALRDAKKTDQALREFEFGDITAEIVMSEACYAQWKRHRMLSLLRQGYCPGLSFTLPQAIYETGMDKVYEREIERTRGEFKKVSEEFGSDVAGYLLPLATNMRTLTKLNVREIYHISRLREDKFAQWDVRQHARELVKLAKQVMPVSLALAGGRHQFDDVYDGVFKKAKK